MTERLSVLAIGSHPDDETIFMGGALAKYAQQGASTKLLVLSSGERGKVATNKGEQGIISFREVDNGERVVFSEKREQECIRAAQVLGIQQVKFLRIPAQGIDSSHLPLLKQQIRQINPHIVLTFSEAGTTAHPDHSWTGLLTFYAIQAILSDQDFTDFASQLNFSSLMTYTLPEADKLLEKYSELITDTGRVVSINVQEVVDIKRRAADCHQTQAHLMDFFQESGILGTPTEHYVERIKREGDTIYVDNIPKDEANYIGSCDDLFGQIVSRCAEILTFIQPA